MTKRMGSACLAATMVLVGMACTSGNVETNVRDGGSDAASDASLDGMASETGLMCTASQRLCGAQCVACPSDANATGTTCNGNACVISACGSGLSPNATGSACVTSGPPPFSGAPVGITRASLPDRFGWSVSLSEDGNTLVVGDHYGGGDRFGAATVYTRSGGTWSTGTNLTPPSGAGQFGTSVSVSGDGNTLVVGDTDGVDRYGTATVYMRSGGNWSTGTNITRPSGASGFGWSVSLSGDGNTLVVGDNNGGGDGHGAATVYTRSGGTWSTGINLTRPNGAAYFGWSVSLSADGNTLVVGDRHGGGDMNGAATIYTRSGGTWSTGTNVIRPSGAVEFGEVSLSGDGNTLVVGDYDGGGDTNGAVSVYTR